MTLETTAGDIAEFLEGDAAIAASRPEALRRLAMKGWLKQ
jgi:hypothetical protein